MSVISSLLSDVVSSDAGSLLAEKSGISSDLIKKAAAFAVPVLLKGVLSKAKSGGKGAEGLLSELMTAKNAGGSVLDSLTNGKIEDGLKTVSSLFGKHEGSIVQELTDHIGDAGTSVSQVKNLLGSLAPGVLNSVASNADISADTKPADLLGALGKGLGLENLSSSDFGIDDIAKNALSSLDLDHAEGLWERIKHWFES